MRIIGYERVSTARQGASGLGIEAQRQAIDGFVGAAGRHADRPLHRGGERAQPGPAGARQGAAPRQGHRGDAGDRQARPAVAQRRLPADAAGQRGAVLGGGPAGGERPHRRHHGAGGAAGARGDLASAPRRRWRWPRSRGVRLGNPNGAAALRRAGKGGAPLRAAIARNADRHARDLAPVVEDIRAGGATSLGAIADELNARGMLTRRGGRWHKSTVMNLLDRLGAAAHAPVPADVAGRGGRQRRGRLRRRGRDADAGVPDVRAGHDARAEPRRSVRSSPRSRWRGATCCGGRSRRSEGDCPAAALGEFADGPPAGRAVHELG